MPDTLLRAIKKRINHKLYTVSDVMELQVVFSGPYDINKSPKHFLKSTVLHSIKDFLSIGELPQLNPDYQYYSNEGEIDDKKLLEYLDKNCYYEIQQLDVKSNHLILTLDLKMIFLNFARLSDDNLEKITYVKVKSFMGESKIGEKKKS